MKIHMVKKGESLYQIAQKYHVDLDKLIEMNPQIADPNVIDVGIKVKIPNAPKPVDPPSDYLYKHTVVQGDTLWKLSKAWNIPLNELIASNPQLKNPNVLMTGDIVYIPKAKSHQQSGHQTNPGNPGKKSTAPIQTAPAPQPAPITEMPEPNVEMPVMPNVNEQPFVPEIQSVPQPPMPVMPNVNQQPFIPEIQSIPQQPMPVMPNVNEQPFVPEIQSMPQQPMSILPNVNQQPFVSEAESMPQQTMPFMPNVNEQPFMPYSAEQGYQPYPAMPYGDNVFAAGQEAMPNMPIHQQPSANLFEQFQVPAAEVMSYDHPQMNMWPQNEPELPYMQQMPTAAQMPYQAYGPTAPYPMHDHHKSGGCGCGGSYVSQSYDQVMPYPYASQMESPLTAHAAQQPYPQMSYPNVPYPSAVSPVGEAPCYPHGYDPRLFGAAYPGPVYPMYGHPMSPYEVPYAGVHDAGFDNQTRGTESEQRDEGEATVGISQKTEKAVAKKNKKKRSSAQIAISRLLQNQRRIRYGSSKPKAQRSPWINV